MTRTEKAAKARIRRLRKAICDTNSRDIDATDHLRAVLAAIRDKTALAILEETR